MIDTALLVKSCVRHTVLLFRMQPLCAILSHGLPAARKQGRTQLLFPCSIISAACSCMKRSRQATRSAAVIVSISLRTSASVVSPMCQTVSDNVLK